MARDEPALQTLIDGLRDGGATPLVQKWGRSGARDWTYREVHDEAARLARGLRQRLRPGEKVAVFAPDGPEWLITALAVVRAGAVLVPIDLQSDADGLAFILDDAEADWVFTAGRYLDTVREARESALPVLLDDPGESEDVPHWRDLAGDDADALPALEADGTAVLFYTSGTTGPPKGVPLSHANLGYQFRTLAEAGIVRSGDRVLLPLPLHHVYAFVVGALTPVHLGLTLIMPYALTGQQLLRAIQDGRASVIIGVPRLYEALYGGVAGRAAEGGALSRLAFKGALGTSRAAERRLGLPAGRWLAAPLRHRIGSQLRLLASGGSPLREDLAWNLQAMGLDVAVGYGLTETSPLLTINPPNGRTGSVGRPAPGTEIRIDGHSPDRDADPADRDGDGEILARGPGVFSGYHKREDKTRSAFTEDGWYRTGDLGCFDDDGYLYVTGRLSTLLVTRSGENVQPDALEQRYVQHPKIRDIGILERDGQLVAVAVPESGEQNLRGAVAEVAGQLPSYQRLVDYRVSRRPLPRTRLGKIRRHELEERYDQAATDSDAAHAEPQALHDMTADDRALLQTAAGEATWKCLAQRYPHSGLSMESDPRLDLGIDSMEWLNLTLDIGERAGVELPEDVIDEVETVRDLVQEVAESAPAEGNVQSPFENPRQQLSAEQRRWLEPRGALLRGTARGLHTMDQALLRSLFRLRIRGLANVPADGPLMLVCNHRSYLDPFALAASLPYRRLQTLYWGGWTGVAFTGAVTRTASRAAQVVPVDSRRGARSSLAMAASVLEAGHGLIWFPEGERSADAGLQSFQPGIGRLLDRYPVPVVLAAIEGGEHAMPVGRRLPRPRPIEVRFAEPVPTEQLAEEGGGDDRSNSIVEALEMRMRHLLEETASA